MRTLVVLVLLALAQPASAGNLFKKVRVTYRLEVVVVDGATFAVTAIGAALDSPVAYAGLTGFVLGTPVLHSIHGKRVSSISSLIMRFTMPLIGAVVGENVSSTNCAGNPDPDCGVSEKERARKLGIGGGMLFVTLIDVVWLARKWELRPVPVQPVVTTTSSGTVFGIAGAF